MKTLALLVLVGCGAGVAEHRDAQLEPDSGQVLDAGHMLDAGEDAGSGPGVWYFVGVYAMDVTETQGLLVDGGWFEHVAFDGELGGEQLVYVSPSSFRDQSTDTFGGWGTEWTIDGDTATASARLDAGDSCQMDKFSGEMTVNPDGGLDFDESQDYYDCDAGLVAAVRSFGTMWKIE